MSVCPNQLKSASKYCDVQVNINNRDTSSSVETKIDRDRYRGTRCHTSPILTYIGRLNSDLIVKNGKSN